MANHGGGGGGRDDGSRKRLPEGRKADDSNKKPATAATKTRADQSVPGSHLSTFSSSLPPHGTPPGLGGSGSVLSPFAPPGGMSSHSAPRMPPGYGSHPSAFRPYSSLSSSTLTAPAPLSMGTHSLPSQASSGGLSPMPLSSSRSMTAGSDLHASSSGFPSFSTPSLPSTPTLSTPSSLPSQSTSALAPMPEARPLFKRSSRIQQRKEKAMASLKEKAKASGASVSSSVSDITPALYMPLEMGADSRFYTSQQARNSINQTIEGTRQTFPSLSSSNLPPIATALRQQAQAQGQSSLWMSTRHAGDHFSSGEDLTYTENTGLPTSGSRTASDTPRPRSPRPEESGTALLPGLRSEQAHQDPYRFTGLPGHTVHAPTQANQVADTSMERFITPHTGGFLVRQDTPTHSTLHAARPLSRGRWETQHVTYQRRLSLPSLPSMTPPGSTASTSSTSSTLPGGSKPDGSKK